MTCHDSRRSHDLHVKVRDLAKELMPKVQQQELDVNKGGTG